MEVGWRGWGVGVGGGGWGWDDASAGDLRVTGDPDAPGPLSPRPSYFGRSDAWTGKNLGNPWDLRADVGCGARHKPILFLNKIPARFCTRISIHRLKADVQ